MQQQPRHRHRDPQDDDGPSPSGRAGGRKLIDSMLQQDGPLDEAEQHQLIAEFEALSLSQARTFRTLFGGGAAAGAALMLYAAYSQAKRPWETRYTGELRTVVDLQGTIAALMLQAAALAATAGALLSRLPPRQRSGGGAAARTGCCAPLSAVGAPAAAALAAAVAAAAGGAVYWGAALRRSVVKHGPGLGAHWDLIWLPLAPLVYVLLCCYITRSVAVTAREVDRLRRLTYEFKKV